MNIEVDGISKKQGDGFHLHVPFLRVDAGDAVGLVGNNGAGKTTLLKLLLDLIPADAGAVRLDGETVAKSTAWKTRAGVYLDRSFLLDFLTPAEFFQFAGSTYGLTREQIEERVEHYRDFLGDAGKGGSRYIRDLSMGNAKKVGLVAAMLPRPALLVLDEPFANLDPRSQLLLQDLVKEMNTVFGSTVFLSSHDLGHVTEVCRRIVVLHEGRVQRDVQTTDETLNDLRRFFSSAT